MSPLFNFTLPLLIQEPTKGLLSLLDEGLKGSAQHFVRFDLYPLISPSHMKRHYGFWDIPLVEIQDARTEILFDLAARTLGLPKTGKVFPLAWQGLVDEEGYCHLHVSIWNKAAEPPQLLALQSLPVIMATKGLDLPLKQICIPVTDRCNLQCTMCPRQGTHEIVDMDVPTDALDAMLEAGPHFVSALLQGQGEPMLYPGIFDLIPRIKAKMAAEGEVGLTTNATLLDQRTAERLLDTGIDFLYFSVDAASKELYESIRVGASFDRVTANIHRCIQYRKDSGRTKPRFMLNFVLLEQNIHEIPAFVELAAQLGVENVTFSYCTDSTTGNLKAFGAEALQDLFLQAHETGSRMQVNVSTPPLSKCATEVCYFMERAVVLIPGRVFPCHLMAPGYRTSARNVSFGDVRHTPLLEIWNQPDYREFRSRVLTGDYPDVCHGCEVKAYLVP
jgi:MoaA/NifB/PqqE/SkfB family radical SAM enzyme